MRDRFGEKNVTYAKGCEILTGRNRKGTRLPGRPGFGRRREPQPSLTGQQ